MLDAHFRGLGPGDAEAVEAWLAGAGETGRRAVVDELRRILSDTHDPYELRLYVMQHRFDMIPADGAEAWLTMLLDLVENSF